ncbi:MAG: hypothetical protein ACRD8A_00035 [Candidatus Acidiferrales bacterium]
MRVVNLPDLNGDDRGFFEKDHGKSCPGLVKVDFYGDHRPTLALVLTGGDGVSKHAELVVAHELRGKWKLTGLDSGDPSPDASVVWSQPPDTYTDVYGNKTIRATRSVIVFCKYESWAILYAWTGKRVNKIWIMD